MGTGELPCPLELVCLYALIHLIPQCPCRHVHILIHIYIYINKNTTILKAWIQKTLQTLQSFLDSRFKIQDSEGNFLNPKPWVWMREV